MKPIGARIETAPAIQTAANTTPTTVVKARIADGRRSSGALSLGTLSPGRIVAPGLGPPLEAGGNGSAPSFPYRKMRARSLGAGRVSAVSLLDSLVAALLPVTPRFIVGRVARRYIAGETLPEAVDTIRRLNGLGAICTVDVLGEFITEFEEAEATARGYEAILDAIQGEKLDANVSVKLTALGLLIDEKRCLDLTRGIVERAKAQASFVRVDMEDSPVTDVTLGIVRRLKGDGLPVGAVLQSYLHRTVTDARALAAEGISVRLCKGIYREPPELAFQDREEVRESYRASLRELLNGEARVAIATHDEVLVDYARGLTQELGIPKERYEYQMLLGVREWLRDELIQAGETVRIYVPFGTAWYGYSTRRLRENPRIAGNVLRAFLGLDRGAKRRRSQPVS